MSVSHRILFWAVLAQFKMHVFLQLIGPSALWRWRHGIRVGLGSSTLPQQGQVETGFSVGNWRCFSREVPGYKTCWLSDELARTMKWQELWNGNIKQSSACSSTDICQAHEKVDLWKEREIQDLWKCYDLQCWIGKNCELTKRTSAKQNECTCARDVYGRETSWNRI